MGLISSIVLAPVTAPAKGLVWLANRIDEAAAQQRLSEPDVHRALAELHAAYDRGHIDDTTFEQQEAVLLDLLDDLLEDDHDHA